MFSAEKLYITEKKYLKRCPYCNSKVERLEKGFMKPSFQCTDPNCYREYYEKEFLPQDYDDSNVLFVHIGVFAFLFQGSIYFAYNYFTKEYKCVCRGKEIEINNTNFDEIFTIENISYLMDYQTRKRRNGWTEYAIQVQCNFYDRENDIRNNFVENELADSKIFDFLYNILYHQKT